MLGNDFMFIALCPPYEFAQMIGKLSMDLPCMSSVQTKG